MKNCKGCQLKHIGNKYRCVLDENEMFKDKIDECPCQNCLVKSMCYSHCPEFLNYLYKPLMKFYLKRTELHDKFIEVSDSKASRTDALIFLQHYRKSLDQVKSGKPRFGVTSKLLQLNISVEEKIKSLHKIPKSKKCTSSLQWWNL